MGDEDGDKRQKYFEDRKRERERQLKEKKKLLDGSDSEVDKGDEKEGKQTQMGAYDTLTLLGTATCTNPSQTKGTTETEHLSSELNKIELNKTTNSPQTSENIKQTDSTEQQVGALNRSSTPTDDDDDIDIDLLSEEEDSLAHFEHMQENSLDAHFNVGTDEEGQARADNQEETPVGPASSFTQEKNSIVPKTEPAEEDIIYYCQD